MQQVLEMVPAPREEPGGIRPDIELADRISRAFATSGSREQVPGPSASSRAYRVN
jgi:hypothetical protein